MLAERVARSPRSGSPWATSCRTATSSSCSTGRVLVTSIPRALAPAMTPARARTVHLVVAIAAWGAILFQARPRAAGLRRLLEDDPPGMGERIYSFFAYFTIESNLLVAIPSTVLAHQSRGRPAVAAGAPRAGRRGRDRRDRSRALLPAAPAARPRRRRLGRGQVAAHAGAGPRRRGLGLGRAPIAGDDARGGVRPPLPDHLAIWTLVFAEIDGWVPYPFMDADKDGWAPVIVAWWGSPSCSWPSSRSRSGSTDGCHRPSLMSGALEFDTSATAD